MYAQIFSGRGTCLFLACTKAKGHTGDRVMANCMTSALPGLLDETVEALAAKNIHTPHQLVGQFLMLKTADADVKQHCYIFWYWLHLCGIRPLQRAYLMDYVGDKANAIFSGSYNSSVFAD